MIRVLLADDENLIRSALATMLDLEDDIEIVGQADSGEKALTVAAALAPDVAVLDCPPARRSSSPATVGRAT
jgi:two-component system response regulator DesR